jgi:hypothetical protein
MLWNFENKLIRSGRTDDPVMPHSITGFDERHESKALKAVIGIVILILLSILFYEIRSTPAEVSSLPPSRTITLANR